MPSETATTGPENPLREYSESETAELKRATAASEQAWQAWKYAKAAGNPEEEVGQLKEKAESAMEYEKSLQDLCD